MEEMIKENENSRTGVAGTKISRGRKKKKEYKKKEATQNLPLGEEFEYMESKRGKMGLKKFLEG